MLDYSPSEQMAGVLGTTEFRTGETKSEESMASSLFPSHLPPSCIVGILVKQTPRQLIYN